MENEFTRSLPKRVRFDLEMMEKGIEMSSDDLIEVKLWYAVGLGGVYYGTKEQCEKEVRKAYPDEDPDTRYARVFYKTFYEEV